MALANSTIQRERDKFVEKGSQTTVAVSVHDSSGAVTNIAKEIGGNLADIKTNTDNIPIDPSTETKQYDTITELQKKADEWGCNDVDDYTTTSVTYVGKEKKDGTWWILKLSETGNFLVITHASVALNAGVTTFTTT